MGMYTELYLACDLKKGTREDIIKWLRAIYRESDYEYIKKICPKELKGTRFEDGLLLGSYYFDGQPFMVFGYDKIPDSYHLTLLTNLKNYNNEIERLLKLFSPYITACNETHIGHIRYEEECVPDVLIYENKKKLQD